MKEVIGWTVLEAVQVALQEVQVELQEVQVALQEMGLEEKVEKDSLEFGVVY